MTNWGMPSSPPSSPWWASPVALPLAPDDGAEKGARLRCDPTVSITTGPPLSVRLLPSRFAGRAGRPLPSLPALAEAAAVLKVKDADPAERTWKAGSPLTSDGSLPAARRGRPLLEAASARLEAAVALGDCNTRTEP